MAGMNLHTAGIEPPPPDPTPPPQPRRYWGNDGLVYEFIQQHGEEGLRCTSCGGKEWKRNVTEIWERTQYVDLSSTSEDEYNTYASQSAADYQNDYEDEYWECQACGQTIRHNTDLAVLLSDIDKETY